MSRAPNNHVPPMTPGDIGPGSAVARNTFWDLLGTGLPILLALVTFPVLIGGIGTAQFGVLTLAWVVLGYFELFDLGLEEMDKEIHPIETSGNTRCEAAC